MTEGLLTDPATTDGQATEAPAAPDSPEMGMGAIESATPLGAPDGGDGQTDEGEAAAGDDKTPSTTDNQDTGAATDDDSADSAAGGLRRDDYTRKTTALADRNRQVDAREAALEQREKAIAAREQGGGQPQDGQPAPAYQPPSRLAQLQQALTNPDMDGDTRQGLQYIYGLEERNEANETRMAQQETRINTLEAQVKQASEGTQALTEDANAQRQQAIQLEIDEAAEIFGNEAVDGSKAYIRRNIGSVNRKTGKPFTIAELVARDTETTVEDARQARQQERQNRGQAKRQASSQAAGATTPDTGGYLTKEQALAEMRKTNAAAQA